MGNSMRSLSAGGGLSKQQTEVMRGKKTMFNVRCPGGHWQVFTGSAAGSWHSLRAFCQLATASWMIAVATLVAAAEPAKVPPLVVMDADAQDESSMKPYVELLEHTDNKIEMLPIKGGKFQMGSPDAESGRNPDEGPVHEVEIEPFWMAKFELTWDAYEVWMFDLDIQRRKIAGASPNARDQAADEYQLTQPTAPYTDMTFGMGKKGHPAICMTQLAARTYCQWLTQKTGRYYRLPTEAEWEYACRAGSKTAYSFGDDDSQLDEFAWHSGNSNDKYHPVGKKKPNPWGLHDMHGNVAEWVLDQHAKDYSAWSGMVAKNPLAIPKTEWGRVVRGGSWDADATDLRSAARDQSIADWKQQDPQVPKSIWYLTDALHVGFRVVRPLRQPTAEELATKWDKQEPVEDRKRGR
ncbi:MAG: formylglycine-generating enzyme family protein [Planctomycetota bacterium]